jgi:hypothetical protein
MKEGRTFGIGGQQENKNHLIGEVFLELNDKTDGLHLFRRAVMAHMS